MPREAGILYRVGIDVGLRSVGFAAIQVDEHGVPTGILNAMSLIHDAGLDPDGQKAALTRKLTAGVARRTRRRYRQRRKRLQALDQFLRKQGYPTPPLDESEEKAGWKARAALATAKIDSAEDLKLSVSHAARHIARHRGWRNPYARTESLLSPTNQHSEGFFEIQKKVQELTGASSDQLHTLGQMVMALPDGTKRLRGEDGLLSARLHQKDFAIELLHIADIQQLDSEFVRELILKVFAAKSPRGSAAGRVGKDELDPSQNRAWRATLEFQQYRIIALLANVRIQEMENGKRGEIRPLTVKERQQAFDLLNTWIGVQPPTWENVAEVLNVDRGQLKGTATSTDDGERVSAIPPVNETERVMANTSIKEFKKYWGKATNKSKDALLKELSNVEVSDEESPEAINAAYVVRNLSPESLEKLESLRLSDGRSAYSIKTLEKLRDYMLNHEADLWQARSSIFGVDKDWAPAAAEIGEPTGNPSVDRVLKATNRWLLMAESKWGTPVSVNIETMRAGFKSEKMARELDREQNARAKKNTQAVQQMHSSLGIEGKPRRSEILRYQAIQRQNGQCAYCGSQIDFKTAELDHIVPRAGAGSTNARNNLLATCKRCNLSKGKLPFAVWAKTSDIEGVSLEEAIARVNQWSTDAGLNSRQMKRFKDDVTIRLKRTTEDESIDARSKESVSWMANELRHRIKQHFGGQAQVRVFRGEVTASARKAAGMDQAISMIGGKSGKNRLDRRHHAVDAAVIALMQDTVAQVVTERNSLRMEEQITRRPDPLYGKWKEFRGRTVPHQQTFRAWTNRMGVLVPLLQDALDADRIPVLENIRLRLGNGLLHEETIHPLESHKLGDALPMELIDRAATPAQWVALTREEDFSWKDGLPENPSRTIRINGKKFGADDELGYFGVKAGALALNGGYVELGSSFHHARLYKINGKKPSYAMLRVYTVDLARASNEDLFSVDLPPQSMSMRQAEKKLRDALREGTAEYVTWFVVGDELVLDTKKIATGQVSTFLEEFGEIKRWRIRGFYSSSRLRLKPSQLSAEGLGDEVSSDSRKVVDAPGWLPSINVVFSSGSAVFLRRDAHGTPRIKSGAGLPVTVKVE